jgi:MazG family protein
MDERPKGFEDLVAIMARLRGPGGCPWDREQTHASLRPYLLEETYEALEAIDASAPDRLREELGDLLLQVVFHAQMAREVGEFTIDDVVAALAEKLIRRHPHVFGDARAETADAVLRRWETIKAEERVEPAGPPSDAEPDQGPLGGLPRALPALALAQQMQARAARAGFDWPGFAEAAAKVREELDELERASRGEAAGHIAEELGDFLFAVANLPRYLGLDGEQALRAACANFRERFARLQRAVRERGRSLGDCSHEELLALWRASR